MEGPPLESERWQTVERIYNAALECTEDQRAAMLASACGNDEALRREVESLLHYSHHAEQAFETPALEVLAQAVAVDLSARGASVRDRMIGARVGQYRIVGKLGTGGMGDVYRASRADEEYQQNVALKLLRSQDSSFFNTQFRNERQILAGLHHPNIARLFDGGTTGDGIPYFAMELIEGQPIDRYCDQQELPAVDRIRLFLQIASAVQYAHQRLIIHRDIKPSNILVTRDGTPVLLDFGIAKIIDPAGAGGAPTTLTSMRMMTPEYACPEQVKGEAITAATDVYSLGVVLYELLTGQRPYRITTHNPLEVARAICEQEPKRPSSAVLQPVEPQRGEQAAPPSAPSPDAERQKWARLLRGDLDAILMKALRKEPERRYATVAELAEDLRRYLDGRPVAANRDTRTYRARKFLIRHRAAVTVAALAFVLAVAGVVSIIRAERVARMQQARAEQRFNDVRTLADSLMFDIHDSIRDLPGSTAARKLLVDRALKYLDSLARESAGDAGLQRDLASAYERVGDVQGSPRSANLGDTAGAIASYRKAVQIRQAVAAAGKGRDDQAALARSYVGLGFLLKLESDFQGSMGAFQQAFPIFEKLAAENKNDPQAQEDYAGVCFAVGQAYADARDLTRSAQYYRRSAEVREGIHSGSPAFQAAVQTRLAGTYGYLSGVVRYQGDLDQAIVLQTKGRDIMARLSAADPNNATLRQYFLQGEYWVGYYFVQKGAAAQALPHYETALAGYQKLVAADSKDSLAKDYLGRCSGSGECSGRCGKDEPRSSFSPHSKRDIRDFVRERHCRHFFQAVRCRLCARWAGTRLQSSGPGAKHEQSRADRRLAAGAHLVLEEPCHLGRIEEESAAGRFRCASAGQCRKRDCEVRQRFGEGGKEPALGQE